ncbi:MAG: cyclic nucleotide-binding domain-containing protein [Gammaproteobacteria bacterium]
MKPEGLEHLLKEHPLFDQINPDYLAIIAGCAANERFNAGATIFREGSPADKFYLIRHGAVALEIHIPGREPLIIDTLHEGDILGWSWLVPPYQWFLDARAVQLCRMVSLDATCLRSKMENDHALGYELYRRFMPVAAKRLQAGRLQLIDMYAQPSERA